MRYPPLVRDKDCKTDIELHIYSEEINEDGAPVEIAGIKTKCNYQNSASQRYDAKHNLVEIYGVALFNGDILPDVADITGGEAIIFGSKRTIRRGIKARNPDGTVNYTRIELL